MFKFWCPHKQMVDGFPWFDFLGRVFLGLSWIRRHGGCCYLRKGDLGEELEFTDQKYRTKNTHQMINLMLPLPFRVTDTGQNEIVVQENSVAF